MKDYRTASRYAAALAALARERDLFDRLDRELREATELVARYPEISHLLRNATVSREEKEDFIGKILPPGFSALTVNFLKVLIKKRRFTELPLVQEKFHRLWEEKQGIRRVRVESPISLGPDLETKLTRALETKTRHKVLLEVQVNPEILGGLVIDFEGTQIDASYRTKLQELKQRLMNPNA